MARIGLEAEGWACMSYNALTIAGNASLPRRGGTRLDRPPGENPDAIALPQGHSRERQHRLEGAVEMARAALDRGHAIAGIEEEDDGLVLFVPHLPHYRPS